MCFSELLLTKYDDYSDDKKKDIISMLLESSRRGFELLENLLTWSRAEQNTIAYNPTDIDMKGVIEGNIYLLKQSAEKKNIQIQINTRIKISLLSFIFVL